MLLLVAFIVVPIIEIAILIRVGGWIGTWETVGLVVLTAIVGTALLRRQGFQVLARAQETLASGAFPARELFDGMCLLVAGALLLTPGFVTDAVGLALLVPGLRTVIGRLAWRALLRSGRAEVHVFGAGPGFPPGGPARDAEEEEDDVIEGEYREVPPDRLGDGDDGRGGGRRR